jgi:hypothetical protein
LAHELTHVVQQRPTESIQRVRNKKFTENEDEYAEKKKSFEQMVAKGKLLYEGMLNGLEENSADNDTAADFSKRYDTDEDKNDKPTNQPGRKDVDLGTKYKTRAKGADETAYENYMNAQQGVMGASYNYMNKDITNEQEVGKRLPNSEILWNQYVMDAKAHDVDVKGLTTIYRLSIASNAQDVIEMCNMKVTEWTNGKEYTPNADEFYALLATDNCKGASFLVTQHKVALGKKKIVSIKAAKEFIVINLGPV